MADVKKWWQSKTILGGLLTIISIILNRYCNIELSSTDYIVILDAITAGTAAFGGGLSIKGRLDAESKIK